MLGQIVQFDTIKFVELLRTILVSSCGLKKKKRHYNSRVSLHEAPTKKTVKEAAPRKKAWRTRKMTEKQLELAETTVFVC